MDYLGIIQRLRPGVTFSGAVDGSSLESIAKVYQHELPIPTEQECMAESLNIDIIKEKRLASVKAFIIKKRNMFVEDSDSSMLILKAQVARRIVEAEASGKEPAKSDIASLAYEARFKKITVLELANRIKQAEDGYNQVLGLIEGMRREVASLINAAETKEQIDIIVAESIKKAEDSISIYLAQNQ